MNKKTQINMFIVEDNKVFALALKADIESAFVNMPIKMQLFETGEACMKEFKEAKPQIVILDYYLNSRDIEAADGIKVLDWIKKENIETSVIMLTCDDHVDIALKSFKHGASDYVVKSDTQFRKIIYSLFNIFKIIDAKSEARKYKRMMIATLMFIAFLIGGVIAIQIFNPLLLK